MAEGHREQGGSGVGFAEYLVEQVLDAEELERLEGAIARRRHDLGIAGEETPEGRATSVSRVKESRAHADGYLQAETRVYKRKDGRESERGPYWYFRYHEGGKQKKLYLGRTDDPEGALAAKRAEADDELVREEG